MAPGLAFPSPPRAGGNAAAAEPTGRLKASLNFAILQIVVGGVKIMLAAQYLWDRWGETGGGVRGLVPVLALAALVVVLAAAGGSPAVALAAPAAGGEAGGFIDLQGHWAQDIIAALAREGIVQGYPGALFKPQQPISRLEFTVILARGLGLAGDPQGPLPFPDAAAIPSWGLPAVTAAYEYGLVRGDAPTGAFNGHRPLNRAELATMLHRALVARAGGRAPGGADAQPGFNDWSLIPDWAREAALNLSSLGIMTGRPGPLFAPTDLAGRAEAAAALGRLLAWLDGEEIRGPVDSPQGGPGNVHREPAGSGGGQAAAGPFIALAYTYGAQPLAAGRALTIGDGQISALAHVGFRLHPGGALSGQPDPHLVAQGREAGLKVLAVINNDGPQGFSRADAAALLREPAHRARAVEEILHLVRSRQYDGINLDMENVDPRDRDHLTAFVAELRDALAPAGYLLTVAVPAQVAHDPHHQWSGAFDYAALGRLADYIVIMTYDEHWAGGAPGPVASMPWVERVVAYARQAMPAGKIILGLAAYGYDWPAAGGAARALSARQAMNLATAHNAAIQWDDTAQTPYFTYWSGGSRRIVHFENRYSAAFKLALARREGLAGVALWRLGLEEADLWQVLAAAGRPIR